MSFQVFSPPRIVHEVLCPTEIASYASNASDTSNANNALRIAHL